MAWRPMGSRPRRRWPSCDPRINSASEAAMPAKATRDAFGEALARLGERYPNLVVLDADLSKSTKSELFAKKFPSRFFEMGIAEANMIGTGTGLALAGKIPFVCSFSCFVSGRFDQLKISVAYSQVNVRVIGSHGGIAVGDDGYSQQGLEDLSVMRSLPGMAVINPADDLETESAVEYLCTYPGPAYLRTTRQKVERVNPEGYRFELGKAVELRKGGSDAVIFATGGEVYLALKAAESLGEAGLKVGVVNIHTLKPLDSAALSESAVGVRLLRVGIPDTFGESGSPEELLAKYKLDARGIAEQVRAAFR